MQKCQVLPTPLIRSWDGHAQLQGDRQKINCSLRSKFMFNQGKWGRAAAQRNGAYHMREVVTHEIPPKMVVDSLSNA